MPVGLILGNIKFYDREVPDHINFGGRQMLAVHKNIGGYRTIDAMGPDPEVIHWSGLLLSSTKYNETADERARLIDALRQSGTQVMLTWPGFAYQVVVQSFSAVYKHQWEISYKIACVVVGNNSATTNSTTISQTVNSDVSTVQNLTSS